MQWRANSSRASSDVRTHRTSRECRLAHAFEIARLTDVERQGNDLGVERGRELRNGRKVLGAARACEHDAWFHAVCPSPVNRSNRFTSALARLASGAITSTVSSPATVPTTSGSCASSMVDAERLRAAQSGPQQHELLHAIDAQQVFGDGALQHRFGRLAVGRRRRARAAGRRRRRRP